MACATPPTPMRADAMQLQAVETERQSDGAAGDVVLKVENLSLDFRLRTQVLHAVRDVSFELRRGETLCLVGESGSGKSVTARALLHILDKNGAIVSGRILLAGKN